MKLCSRLIIGFLSVLMLSGCGWHLRGSLALEQIDAVHVSAQDPNSAFASVLTRELASQRINVADNASDASYSIVILNNRSDRRTISVSGNNKAAEFLIIEEVDFLLLGQDGQPLGSKRSIVSERTYDHDEDRPLSKDNEYRALRQEVHQNLAQQILRALDQAAR